MVISETVGFVMICFSLAIFLTSMSYAYKEIRRKLDEEWLEEMSNTKDPDDIDEEELRLYFNPQ